MGTKNYFEKEFLPVEISGGGVSRINSSALSGKLTEILFDIMHLNLYQPFKITQNLSQNLVFNVLNLKIYILSSFRTPVVKNDFPPACQLSTPYSQLACFQQQQQQIPVTPLQNLQV